MNSEINDLLNVQKQQLDKIEEKKVLLLGSAQGESKYDYIKEAFNWDDTDKLIRSEVNKSMELSIRIKENIDSSILVEDLLFKYCINNNYALCNVREYKGRIPVELLKAIDEYCIVNDRRLTSEANIGNLFILCEFTSTVDINNNLKKSVRYDSSKMPKLILLERLDKGNTYNETHYKTIIEIGEKRDFFNKIKSIFLTHTKVANHLYYLLFYSALLLLALTIVFVVSSLNDFTVHTYNSIFYINYWLLIIPLIALIGKSLANSSYDGMFRYYNDIGYEKLDRSLAASNTFLTSKMYPIFNRDNNSNYHILQHIGLEKLVIIKNQIAFWLMHISFFLVFIGIIHLEKMYFINKNKRLDIAVNRIKAPDKVNEITTFKSYKATSPLTYSAKEYKETTKNKIK